MDLIFGSKAAFLSAVLVCACGGSAESGGAGGASSAGAAAKGGESSNGASGSPATSNPNGSSGAGASGAGNVSVSSGDSCPAFTPCGGELLGDWKLEQMCLQIAVPAALTAFCPDVKLTLSPVRATGTVSFKADNTMTSSAEVSFDEHIQFPTSCLTEDLCSSYASQLSTAPGVTTGHCDYDTSTGCSCTLTSSQPSMNSGTYQVQGGNVTVTNATGAMEVDSFCVSANTLRVRGPSRNGNSSSLVLTR